MNKEQSDIKNPKNISENVKNVGKVTPAKNGFDGRFVKGHPLTPKLPDSRK